MPQAIAVLGAGGKMGFRVTRKLIEAGHDVRAMEIGEAGRARLADAGIEAISAEQGIEGAQAVVLALPDTLIGRVSQELSPRLPDGAMLVILDAAAPYAGQLPADRPSLTYFVGHPCHPPLYNDEIDPAARRDYHGGIARQAIVCCLMQGPEAHYEVGAAICRDMWSPVTTTHRVTLEQLAVLEPGLSEMVAMPFVDTMFEAVEECERRHGIPRQAAMDFLIGHLNVEIAMWFGFSPKVPSDAALNLMRFAKSAVVRDDWREALSLKKIKEASELIVRS